MINRSDLSKIGVGTWGIGGFAERDEAIDKNKQVRAITHMLNSGINLVQANNWYSQGYAVEILSEAIRQSGIQREDLFIIQAIYLPESDISHIAAEVDSVLAKLNIDHVDTLQILSLKHGSRLYTENDGFERIAEIEQDLLAKGKTRFISVTNQSLEVLQLHHERFGNKLFSLEVCFNLEVRANETEGLIPYAHKNGIQTIVYQPLRRNRTANHNWPILVEMSKKYGVSQNQILLAWIIARRLIPLTKSETIEHIDEHLAATKLQLEQEDIELLNNFTPPSYTPPKVDWNKEGIGVPVDQLSNVFDEDYAKQQSK